MIRLALFLPLAGLSCAVAAQSTLVPPPGYYAEVVNKPDKNFTCDDPPAPYTDTLDFPSKYEGSGKARDQLNEQANADYKKRSEPISQMEKGVNKLVDKYMRTGNADALQCVLKWYTTWADANALLGPSASYSGKAMRKWSLASLSGAFLHLQFSRSQPLAAFPEQTQKIKTWLGLVGDKVLTEWDLNSPREKINNHFYWAAWAIMATSVVENRRDEFDWAVKTYRIFASQVDNDGYLPNELARQTRALGYHNFAITPLSMIAAFGKANGVDLASEGNGALKRLAERTLAGINDPQVFSAKSGYPQELEDVSKQPTELAWIEPYCWAASCQGPIAQKAESLRPMKNTRLGGDVTAVFHDHH
ncbi:MULTISPECIES: mannuronate-specific alginate lyase [Dyella]|uniref:Mannuronate-specific alginate lyase n=3 Tax=Dyella TaxID=231454 RepID=A0A4R0YYV0_9GAMM|nr:mannuronate-specific alginate lyase [Dyella terrae]TCI13841.1 mannuronate-specific alginate lyase [Dyella soli]